MILAKEESQTEVCATKFNMSATAETIQSKPASGLGSPWSLWLRQIAAIMRLDVKRNFFGKRAVLIYLMALMPIGLLSLMAILPRGSPGTTLLNILCASR